MEEQPEKEKKKNSAYSREPESKHFRNVLSSWTPHPQQSLPLFHLSHTSYHHTLDHYHHQEGILWDISMSGTGARAQLPLFSTHFKFVAFQQFLNLTEASNPDPTSFFTFYLSSEPLTPCNQLKVPGPPF